MDANLMQMYEAVHISYETQVEVEGNTILLYKIISSCNELAITHDVNNGSNALDRCDGAKSFVICCTARSEASTLLDMLNTWNIHPNHARDIAEDNGYCIIL